MRPRTGGATDGGAHTRSDRRGQASDHFGARGRGWADERANCSFGRPNYGSGGCSNCPGRRRQGR